MKLYVVEDLTEEHMRALRERLDAMEMGSGMDGLYWLPLPEALLSDLQCAHTECAPHCMALETTADSLRLELLVRARNRLRCDCVSYASPQLREHMVNYLNTLLDELGIYI